jgi:hypothetical protein
LKFNFTLFVSPINLSKKIVILMVVKVIDFRIRIINVIPKNLAGKGSVLHSHPLLTAISLLRASIREFIHPASNNCVGQIENYSTAAMGGRSTCSSDRQMSRCRKPQMRSS